MRYITAFFLVCHFSCSEKVHENKWGYFADRLFTVDTLTIDSKDEILFLNYELMDTDISGDERYLYNFNINDHTLEKINLDRLVLENKLPFEKEGPNGTGPFVSGIKVYKESQIMINGMNQCALFSLNGEKLKTIYFENFSLGGHPMEGGDDLRFGRKLDQDTNRLYGIILSHKDKSQALGILELDKLELTKIRLDTFEGLSKYTFSTKLSNVTMTRLPEIEIEKFGKKVVLSNEITNSIMWLDTEMDTLINKSYNSQITANEKIKDYKLDHDGEESFEVEYGRFLEEINFIAPFWDEKNQVFYRFSYQNIPSGSKNNEKIKSKVYLTALDKDLNMIGETFLPQLTKKPAKHFAKDGNIWIYENMNDEMGFVRLSMMP